jgi:hypothetical protein
MRDLLKELVIKILTASVDEARITINSGKPAKTFATWGLIEGVSNDIEAYSNHRIAEELEEMIRDHKEGLVKISDLKSIQKRINELKQG